MPMYKQDVIFEVARDVKAFLKLEAGLTRGELPGAGTDGHSWDPKQARMQEQLEQTKRQLAEREKQITRLQGKAAERGKHETLNPENIVWIFGTARTGSTWLGRMMADLKRHNLWDEPLLGALFGDFHYGRAAHKKGKNSLLGGNTETRVKLIRSFVLMAARERFPRIKEKDYIVVKEPNGSIGAPLLAEGLPESRLILLIRDPRDVVSSNLSGKAEGGWFREARNRQGRKINLPEDPDDIVRSGARKYRKFVGNANKAFESHASPKVLVRYEELRIDTLATMKRIYSELEIPVDEKRLAQVVKKHSWENIPEKKKGQGRRTRKATPGGWREDLSAEQARMVEEITAPLLKEFYPG
jgi:hypothetical protein